MQSWLGAPAASHLQTACPSPEPRAPLLSQDHLIRPWPPFLPRDSLFVSLSRWTVSLF